MPVQPPRPKGPPLNALRAFETAARLGSFSHAADELCVTPGAVAQHIRALEDWAGAPLFERHPRGVALTLIGHAVAPLLGAAFDDLAGAVHALRRMAAPTQIRIAALPSVAQLWLSPRLPKIRAIDPSLTISITALETPPNLAREPYDIAVFFGLDADDDIRTIPLAEDDLTPACAPGLAGRLTGPASLAQATLLHDAAWRDDWAVWLADQNIRGIDTASGPTFSLYSLAVEEAVHGAGILIAHLPLVERHLSEGSLVTPFDARVRSPSALTAAIRDGDWERGSPIRKLIERFSR